jgi:predicted enzyme related to lactoylglutathione lyase
MGNPFVHIELNTSDVAKAKKFYGALLDWDLKDMPMGDGTNYTVVNVGEGTGGGMFKNPMPEVPPFWLAYISVPNVEAATKKAESLGAKVHKGKTEVPNMGWFSVLQDPTGAVFALWQAKS